MVQCPSIGSNSVYPVTVTSNPNTCHVTVRQNGAVIHEGTTPFQITLKAKLAFFRPATCDVEFKKKGMETQTMTLTGRLNVSVRASTMGKSWLAGRVSAKSVG